nr:Maf family protein [bacterium]
MQILLASASPRRRELIGRLGYPVRSFSPDCDERVPGDWPPDKVVAHLARLKAGCAQPRDGECLIAADTVVALGGVIFGKPADTDDARRMLMALSGRVHTVYTGVCMRYGGREESFVCQTNVTFDELLPAEIEAYIATGEPMDKAGAYGAQGFASSFIRQVDGNFDSVIGLPLCEVRRRIREFE